MTLLTKTRMLNKLLQKVAGHPVNFKEMAEVLKDSIHANVYVLSRKGKLLGYAVAYAFESIELQQIMMVDRRLPVHYNNLLLKIEETFANDDPQSPYITYTDQIHHVFEHEHIIIVPIIGGGDRLGTLVLSRANNSFIDDDLIMAEYGSTIVGMEILRERTDEIEEEARTKTTVQVAVNSLSFSELEAVEHIFEELKGKEGLLVASKIADRVGITRSVIVNALRKLESAGVIETRSLGMKGTRIKILNNQLVQEVIKTKI